MYQDKTMTCRDCSNEFIFTAGEQEFYATKGFENEPSRCPECRAARKQSRNAYGQPRQMFTATCTTCGSEAEVPFKPHPDKPVYCRDCYQTKSN